MSTYVITQTTPATDPDYVYAQVLINDEVEPRQLILPADPQAAQDTMSTYLAAPENQPIVSATDLVTPLDTLVDQTIEV